MVNIDFLNFFDKNANNMNLTQNESSIWQGSVFFKRTSVGLIDVQHVFVLEKILKSNGREAFIFPRSNRTVLRGRLSDPQNPNIFLFDADTRDSETAFIERIESRVFELDDDAGDVIGENGIRVVNDVFVSKAISFNIGFLADSQALYDNIFILEDYTDSESPTVIAEIALQGEGIEEDERLRIAFENLYDKTWSINPDDLKIFRDVEYRDGSVNFEDLNDKRKELLLQSPEIFGFLGSDKALINILNYFGYPDVTVKQYWKNIDPNSDHFNQYRLSQMPYQLRARGDSSETFNPLPSAVWRKTTLFGLFYNQNMMTGEYDQFDVPILKDDEFFSTAEALVKMFALSNYLKSRFLPLNSKLVDIVAERSVIEKYNLRTSRNEIGMIDIFLPADIDFNVSGTGIIEDLRPYDNLPLADSGYTVNGNSGLTVLEIQNTLIDQYKDNLRGAYADAPAIPVGARMNLSVTSFDIGWDELEYTWDDMLSENTENSYTWDSIRFRDYLDGEWILRKRDVPTFEYRTTGDVSVIQNVEVILPFVGNYDVELRLFDIDNNFVNRVRRNFIVIDTPEVQFSGFYRKLTGTNIWDDYPHAWGDAPGTWDFPNASTSSWDDMNMSFDSLLPENYIEGDVYDEKIHHLLNVNVRDETVEIAQDLKVTADNARYAFFSKEYNSLYKNMIVNSFSGDTIVVNELIPLNLIRPSEFLRFFIKSSLISNVNIRLDSEAKQLKFEQDLLSVSAVTINLTNTNTFTVSGDNLIGFTSVLIVDSMNNSSVSITSMDYDASSDTTTVKFAPSLNYCREDSVAYYGYKNFDKLPFNTYVDVLDTSGGTVSMYYREDTRWFLSGANIQRYVSVIGAEIDGFDVSEVRFESNSIVQKIVDGFHTASNETVFVLPADVLSLASDFRVGTHGYRVDYDLFFGEYTMEVIGVSQLSGSTRLSLDDPGTILDRIGTLFNLQLFDFDIVESQKWIRKTYRFDDFDSVGWDDLSGVSWDFFVAHGPINTGFIITAVTSNAKIQIDDFPVFQFNGVAGLTLEQAALQLNGSDIAGIDQFQYYVGEHDGENVIFAVARNLASANLVYVQFDNGASGINPDAPFETSSYPLGNFNSWIADIGLQDTNRPPDWNRAYRIWNENGSTYPKPGQENFSPSDQKTSYLRAITGDFTIQETFGSEKRLELPIMGTAFMAADASLIAGKTAYAWRIYNELGTVYRSTKERIFYTFPVAGLYSVELEITDSNSNVKRIAKNDYIQVK